jgi:hypothetical protein
LAQEAGKAGVWMEAIPFQGAAATEMATSLIEAFTSHNIELYDDPALIADLKRLRIEERPNGWRLAADRTAHGHCDRGTALALALLAAKRCPVSAPMPEDELIQALRHEQESRPRGFAAMDDRYRRLRQWTPGTSDDEDDPDSGWMIEGGGEHGGAAW